MKNTTAFEWINEEFHRKTGYINFCQFDIFAIEAAEIYRK